MKTIKEREAAVELLERQIKNIKNGHVNWLALSVKFHSGEIFTLHTRGAPKRPKGVS